MATSIEYRAVGIVEADQLNVTGIDAPTKPFAGSFRVTAEFGAGSERISTSGSVWLPELLVAVTVIL